MEPSAQLLTPALSRPKLTTNADELREAVVLEDAGAAMAGLVGLLRQLGDLAQLAAEVFHGLHDQATAVSARARGLTLGARRLEEALPLVEERLRHRRNGRICLLHTEACIRHRPEALCRVAGHRVDRPPPVIVVGGTRPCSIEKLIQRCRGPPLLSMLDKYDAGGEGACLKRYTDPSFFRALSAQHETKPDLQSSGNHSKPPAEEAHHKKYSKFKTGALSDTLRRLKYRHMIGRIRRQMQNFQNQDSSEDEASEVHVLSSADPPEISNTKVPCPSVLVNKERSSDLVERTSSFGAWLSPGEACTHACDITQRNADGSASHGANSADENANIATNGRSALVDFMASRVESSPRKLSVKKHSDPLAESFRNMAKKLLLENGSAQNFRNNELVHSEDAPDQNEVAFYTKSTGETQQGATSEQPGDPCEIPCSPASIDEETSGGITDRNPKGDRSLYLGYQSGIQL